MNIKVNSIGSRLFLANMILLLPLTAMAHHPLGGRQPETVMEGLLSGIGHPVLGLDHLTFIVAVGLLAGVIRKGFLIPIGMIIGSMAGLGAHLLLINVPGNELFIAASVIIMGLLLSIELPGNWQPGTLLGAMIGILLAAFHGYAYAEAVVGVSPVVLASYIPGLAAVQLAIALACWYLVNHVMKKRSSSSVSKSTDAPVRIAGFAVAGLGVLFLWTGLS